MSRIRIAAAFCLALCFAPVSMQAKKSNAHPPKIKTGKFKPQKNKNAPKGRKAPKVSKARRSRPATN